MELGLSENGKPVITQEQIDELKAHADDINYDVAGFPFSLKPSSISVSANAIHNLLQVLNFISCEKMYCISLLA